MLKRAAAELNREHSHSSDVMMSDVSFSNLLQGRKGRNMPNRRDTA